MIASTAIEISRKSLPVTISLLSDTVTPVEVFDRLSSGEQTAFLFESTEGDSRLARYSFIGLDPLMTVAFKNGQVTVKDRQHNTVDVQPIGNPLRFLKDLLETQQFGTTAESSALPFSGGLVGYLGYGATRYLDSIPQQGSDPFGVPEGYYGLYDAAIVFDHQYGRINVISHRGEEHARALVNELKKPSTTQALSELKADGGEKDVFEGVTSNLSKEAFLSLVNQSKENIKKGEVFQIVVSQRFSLPISSTALDCYRFLRAVNPSPYAYVLKCPGFSYIGSSPETFVKCQNNQVVLRALAGTRPRGQNSQEDSQMEVELLSSEKELAEHRMLVDLGRNDLGRVCSPGTIKVGEIATLTKYTHVMHLATEITGRLQENKTCFDVFQSCFPRGTVSGAPKIRAMQILSQLEAEQRGIYSGVVGYFDLSGNMDGAIAIRSALIKDGMAHVNAGAGVVYDSDPLAEYEETRNKARSVIQAIKLAQGAMSCQ